MLFRIDINSVNNLQATKMYVCLQCQNETLTIKTLETMKTSFQKQEVNENFYTDEYYFDMFKNLGFENLKIQKSFTNGASAYIRLNAKVLNVNKFYCEPFVYDGITTLTVRVSEHKSGLELHCDGVCGNKISFKNFKYLVENNIITENK